MIAPLAFLLPLVLVAPVAQQDPDPPTGFDELADGFLDFYLYFNPVRSSMSGERDYDSRLPDVSRAALQARAEAYQLWLDRLGFSSMRSGQSCWTSWRCGGGNAIRPTTWT